MKYLIVFFIIFSKVSCGEEIISIPRGTFLPMYGIEKDQKEFEIKAFRLDKFPVSELAFIKFLDSNTSWKRENISAIFADEKYLKDGLSPENNKIPITNISWFVANAYCNWVGGRLPTTLEWEYVAAASAKLKNASNDLEYNNLLLDWYSKPLGEKVELVIGKKHSNWFGISDMHSLVWEWTYDFNSVFITSDNRQDGDKEKGLYCGGSSIGARSKEDYAAFIRYSLRGSLQARYSINNLGFRCAYDK